MTTQTTALQDAFHELMGGDRDPAQLPPAEFNKFVRQIFSDRSLENMQRLLDVTEELLRLNQGPLAFQFWREAAQETNSYGAQNYRYHLLIGASAMAAGEMDQAEFHLVTANRLAPGESAAHANLAQIYFAQERDDKALEWCEAGLKLTPNQRQLWEVFAKIQSHRHRDEGHVPVQDLAQQLHSWMGHSLACSMASPDDPNRRAESLQSYYDAGERSGSFLVEYTGALGAAERYQEIPVILATAKAMSEDELPWQLYVHGAQAYAAARNFSDALRLLDGLQQDQRIPPQVGEQLEAFYQELIEEQAHEQSNRQH